MIKPNQSLQFKPPLRVAFLCIPSTRKGMAISAKRSQGRSIIPRKEPGAWIAKLTLDDRSLALFRIGIGLIAVFNVIARASSGEFLTSSQGITFSDIINRAQDGAWSFHWLASDSTCLQLAILVGMGLCALIFAAGLRSPLSAAFLLLFTVSLHNNNPLIINTGDRQLATRPVVRQPTSTRAGVDFRPAAAPSRCRCQRLPAKK
ncbi:MAG: hypothetical protein ACK5GZ_05505 [Cyanobium sp.]|jgi:hypothetical protein